MCCSTRAFRILHSLAQKRVVESVKSGISIDFEFITQPAHLGFQDPIRRLFLGSARSLRSQRRTGTQSLPTTIRLRNFAQSLIYAGAANADGIDSLPFRGYYFRLVNGNSSVGTTGYVSGSHEKNVVVLVA
jgi:hypothetical protein